MSVGKKENGVLIVNVLNVLIALFSKLGKEKAVGEVFDKIENFVCVPNKETYCFSMEALCQLSTYD